MVAATKRERHKKDPELVQGMRQWGREQMQGGTPAVSS